MISLPPTVKIFLATQPADMRKSFDGLKALVEEFLDEDPLSGHLFVFRNRRGDRLKILWWDRDGLAVFYKRLEVGTFPWPRDVDAAGVVVRPGDLAMLLDGVDPASVRRGRRYARPA
jgi:transposase